MTESSGTRDEDWIGDRGDRWLAEVDGFEALLEPVGLALFDHAGLEPGQTVLDIGCGGGWTSREAARRVGPRGTVRGIDISPALAEEAARRAATAGLANVGFDAADAATVRPVEAPFDRLISRFGVMFFADPGAAFGHLRSLLSDRGRIDLAVWAPPADNPWMSGARTIVAAPLPLPRPDPAEPGPFALSDPERLRTLLSAAGFTDVAIDSWGGTLSVGGSGRGAEAAADFAMRAFAFADAIEAADPSLRDRIRRDLIAFYRAYDADGDIAAPARVWLVSARA